MAAKKARGKKAGSKKGKRLQSGRQALARLEADLRLGEFTRQVRGGLSKLERQLESAQQDARKRWTRLLRDVSHQLGRIEAEGEKRWRQQTTRARHEALKVLRKLEKALEATPKRAAHRKPAQAPAPRAAAPVQAPAPRPSVPAPAPRAPFTPSGGEGSGGLL
jgi:hypothetical protein